jgi:hypothetical protein
MARIPRIALPGQPFHIEWIGGRLNGSSHITVIHNQVIIGHHNSLSQLHTEWLFTLDTGQLLTPGCR